MKLIQIMTKDVEFIQPDDTISMAAQKMRDRDIGFLPVIENGELIGVITDRDLVIRVLTEGVNPKAMIGRDVLTSPAIYCFDDQEVESAVQLMQLHQIRRLVVLDRNDGRVVGVVSLGDLATNISPDVSGGVLQDVSSEPVEAG